MRVFIERDNVEKTVEFSGNCSLLLKLLNVNPEEVLIVKNGELVSLDESLEDTDLVKLLSVVSGG